MKSLAAFIVPIALAATGAVAAPDHYSGLCEASAAALLGDKFFAVASDETNRIQIYERGHPEPLGKGVDFEAFTGFDKSDVEGAAAIEKRIYWISSHSFNSNGEDKAKRKILFATDVVEGESGPTLKSAGTAYKSLRDTLVDAAKVKPADINIEGLAATTDGKLLIGFRRPVGAKGALVLQLENPSAVIERSEKPRYSEPIELPLGGRGTRSIERIGSGPQSYLIVAGPVSDSNEGFALYWWSGPATKSDPALIQGIDLQGIRPEAVIAIPGTTSIQILSDDGDICSDEDTPKDDRKFRSIDIKP